MYKVNVFGQLTGPGADHGFKAKAVAAAIPEHFCYFDALGVAGANRGF